MTEQISVGAIETKAADDASGIDIALAFEEFMQAFEAFKDSVLQVDGSRRTAFDLHETQLRKDFERTADRTNSGYSFTHPKRLNLLKRL